MSDEEEEKQRGRKKPKVKCSKCGAKRWNMQQMMEHIAKKHPKGDKK